MYKFYYFGLVALCMLFVSSCGYLPTKLQESGTGKAAPSCQSKCSMSGMRVDHTSQSCACISFPGK